MKIEVYVPDHEIEVIGKILELKERRKLSSYIVELLKKDEEYLTKEQVIKLINEYTDKKNTSKSNELEGTIQSILSGF